MAKPPRRAKHVWVTSGHRNLGLWGPGPCRYTEAAEALAHRVGTAAELSRGARALELGCGAGGALRLWRDGFGASQVVGLEPDPAQFAAARRLADDEGITVLRQPASSVSSLGLGAFDAVLAVDAAYHFDAHRWLQAAAQVLRPGGRLAFTDFVSEPGLGARRVLLKGAARLCRFGPGAPMDLDALTARLSNAGLTLGRVEDLSEAVLDGFAGWVASGAPEGPGVGEVALQVTARLCRVVRSAKLARYVLVWAHRTA